MSALSITILVCALGQPPRDCNADNAIAVVKPSEALYSEYSGLAGCLSFSQRFGASLPYAEHGYLKTVCRLGAPPASVG